MGVHSRRRLKEKIDDFKSLSRCEECGECDSDLLEMHHVGEKNFSISFGIRQQYALWRILEEIELTKVLCANCHRKFHILENKRRL